MTADPTTDTLPGRVLVTTEPLDPVAEQDLLTAGNKGIGAVCSFDGLVRAISQGQDDSLSLEHYPGMTESALADIRQEAGQRWPLLGLSILHRVGRMRPGDRIVSVIAASAHRQAAFDAAAFTMDYLKTRAPFWKLEDDGSGGAKWVEARDGDDRAAAKW